VDARELEARLARVAASEARFIATVESIDESSLAGPSLLPGWSRGHVVAHVALNARSNVNLMNWARTGEETPQYPSGQHRADDIERFSSRTKSEHLAALRKAAAMLMDAMRALPLDRWDFPVRGLGSGPRPISRYLDGRVNEVEIHHVDLDAGYDSNDWPEEWVARLLKRLPEVLEDSPRPFSLEPDDLDVVVALGSGPPIERVSGPAHALLKWCIGRSAGDGLGTEGGTIPEVPPWD
jgi:maleylpyruvate isomerase